MSFPEKTCLICQSTGNETEAENGQILFAKNYSKPNWMIKFLFFFDILNYFGFKK